jgi:hypothetical protein
VDWKKREKTIFIAIVSTRSIKNGCFLFDKMWFKTRLSDSNNDSIFNSCSTPKRQRTSSMDMVQPRSFLYQILFLSLLQSTLETALPRSFPLHSTLKTESTTITSATIFVSLPFCNLSFSFASSCRKHLFHHHDQKLNPHLDSETRKTIDYFL